MSCNPVEPHLAGVGFESLPAIDRSKLRVVLEQVRSAFNTGALFRTADAAAVELIHLIGVTPHPPHAQVEKTALGATSYVPWRHYKDSREVIEELKAEEFTLVALDNGPGAVDFWEFEWPRKTALVAGSEVDGVSPEMLEACAGRVNIPMFGYKRSLNVTTALGIAVYEYLRVHHRTGTRPDPDSRTFLLDQGLIRQESEKPIR